MAAAFEQGRQLFRAGRFEDAHSVFQRCIEQEPGSLLPVEAMLQNLASLHGDSAPSWMGRWTDSSAKRLTRACSESNWLAALRLAPAALKAKGQNGKLFRAIAIAAQNAQLHDVELRYWHAALEYDSGDLATLVEAGRGYARQGTFAEARECWTRILKLEPNHSAAATRLEILGRFGEPNQLEMAKQWLSQEPDRSTKAMLFKVDEWEAAGLFDAAEFVLNIASESTSGDWGVRERSEGHEIRRKSAQLAIASQMAKLEQSESAADSELAADLVQRLAEDLNRLELDLFNRRSQQFPAEPHWRLELARRLRIAGMYFEAADQFEAAATDETATECQLEQGECLQQVRQFDRAIKCYLTAADLLDRAVTPAAEDAENQLDYRVWRRLAVLAEAMGRPAEAVRALKALQAISPDDETLQARLDKLAAMGDKG